MKTTASTIEPLEPHIAPASLTFTGVDGDKAIITGGHHFGFVAHQIGSFKAAGFTASLDAATAHERIELSPNTPTSPLPTAM